MEINLNKKYGILLSGGLDSAVLLYLIIKKEPNVKLQPFTIPKHDGSALYANPIIAHFNAKFGTSIPETTYVGDPNLHHTKQSGYAMKEIFSKYPVDVLFMGVNTNPPELDALEGAPRRILKSPSPSIVYPFAHMLKDEILSIMFAEGQQDLSDITHSCTEQQQGRCGQCWQCTERAWAFKRLNQLDTGKL